jgi:predicted nucleic acid-binding protein
VIEYVADPGVVLKWYLPEVLSEECRAAFDSGATFHAPDVLFAQVGNALWRRVRAAELKPEIARQILDNLKRLPLEITPTEGLLREAIEISTITSRTFYESLYFVLAIRRDTVVLTADRRWHSLVATGPMKQYVKLVTDLSV